MSALHASSVRLVSLFAVLLALSSPSCVSAFYYNFYTQAGCPAASLQDSGSLVLGAEGAVRPAGYAVCTNSGVAGGSIVLVCNAAAGSNYSFAGLSYKTYNLTSFNYPNYTTCPSSLWSGLPFYPNGTLGTSPLQPLGSTVGPLGACVPSVDTMSDWNGVNGTLALASGYVQVDCLCRQPIVLGIINGNALYGCNDTATAASSSTGRGSSSSSGSNSASSIAAARSHIAWLALAVAIIAMLH